MLIVVSVVIFNLLIINYHFVVAIKDRPGTMFAYQAEVSFWRRDVFLCM